MLEPLSAFLCHFLAHAENQKRVDQQSHQVRTNLTRFDKPVRHPIGWVDAVRVCIALKG